MALAKKFLILAIIGLLGIFAFQNQTFLGEMVQLKLFKYQVSMILGLWLVLSFVCGALLFLSIDLPRTFKLRRELRRKSQDMSRLQTELGRLQSQAAVTGNLAPTDPSLPKSEKPPHP
jgi:uncharacterized integral membrane protein